LARKFKIIDYAKRMVIEELYSQNWSIPDIADHLGYTLSTIYRELDRGNTGTLDVNGRCGYKALIAQEKAEVLRKNRGRRRLNRPEIKT